MAFMEGCKSAIIFEVTPVPIPVGQEKLQYLWGECSRHWKNREQHGLYFLMVLGHRCEYWELKEGSHTDI